MELTIINSETGKFEEKTLTASDEEYLVGRHSRCNIVFDGPDISRVHGRFVHRKGNFYYIDLGSTCGSWINNIEIAINERYLLRTNDTIRIGSFLIIVGNLTREAATNQLDSGDPDRENDLRWWHKGTIEVICQRIVREANNTKTFILSSEAGTLFSYKPGQFVNLHLNIDGKPVKRSYSISSTPTRPHTLEITVKRVPAPPGMAVPDGLVSNWLHDNIAPGSKITISGPFGKFTCCDRASEKLLFISAGSGITPMMSMSRWLLDLASDTDITFFYNARTPRDIIFHRELELFASRYANFTPAIALTRSSCDYPWTGYTGRLNEAMLQSIAPDFQQRVVYVCGPDGFMEQVKTMLSGLGFPMENFYQESFGGPKRRKAPAEKPPAAIASSPDTSGNIRNFPTDPSRPLHPAIAAPQAEAPAAPAPKAAAAAPAAKPTVVFAASKEELACPPDKSILELALEEGIEIQHACCAGACGNCQVKHLSGEYRYLQDPSFTPEEGHILTCVATAVGRVEIAA